MKVDGSTGRSSSRAGSRGPAGGSRQPDGRRSVHAGWLALWCAAYLAAGDAAAIGLGNATLGSGLGEPLRLSFPISLQPNEEAGCVQVRAKSEELPTVFNTRSSVVRNAFQTRIEVTSAQPVNEPAIGIVVSVGCASPIAREYVLFLDPPIVPAVEALAGDRAPGASSLFRDAPGRNTPRRRVPRAAAPVVAPMAQPPESAPSTEVAPVRQPTRPRRARPRPAALPAADQVARKAPSESTSSLSASAPVARGGDRLTVAPTEAAPAAPTLPAQTISPAPSSTASSAAPSPAPSASVPPLAAAGTAASGGTAASSDAVPTSASEPNEREQALRQQQADLQKQLKSLGDQIAALRVQTTSLTTRNQVLEESSLSPALVWMLIALAVLATLIAGWMTWRYTQLRRSMGDAAWWSGNSVLAPGGGAPATSADSRMVVAPLDAATRLGQRSANETDARASGAMPANASASIAQADRARPGARSAPYAAAMDTDFTVSDIEAAMATVRTVSPQRDAKRSSLEDSDFAALGSPTQPSPFAEPPPPAPRPGPVAQPVGADLGNFVDLEIPPSPAARSPVGPAPMGPRSAVRAAPPAVPVEPEALDFKLDIPAGFDPLATDSLKTTVVDHANAVDFDLPATPTALDFELPSVTAIAKADADLAEDGTKLERHGATALGDLFPSLGGPGPDTILDLDDRDGAPLSTTEVDRLTTTAVDAIDPDSADASTRVRLTRFADLMNQVDEAASGDPLHAIAHLRQYVLRDEQIPTLLWLRLFELYRAVDKKPVYEALSEHFARRYGRPMIGWDEALGDRVPQTPLAAMASIDREIESLWGREAGIERLRQLLCDRDQDDAIVFNAVLQRDLLDAAKVFPREERG